MGLIHGTRDKAFKDLKYVIKSCHCCWHSRLATLASNVIVAAIIHENQLFPLFQQVCSSPPPLWAVLIRTALLPMPWPFGAFRVFITMYGRAPHIFFLLLLKKVCFALQDRVSLCNTVLSVLELTF